MGETAQVHDAVVSRVGRWVVIGVAAHQLYDQERQSQLEAQGYRVLRFTNEAVLGKTDSVLDEIRRAVHESEAC